jgi:hypothetical protein
MKKTVSFVLALSLVLLCRLAAQTGAAGTVEVSFSFTRQRGSASNQFAVWVEDAGGRLVKTLYATRYTAGGGWERRPESIPLWVGQSGLAALGRREIDAFTGATPRSGNLRYLWDGTGPDGAAVPPGLYRVFVEGSLRWENRVLYRADVELGGASAEVRAAAEYFGDSAGERGMLGPVTVRYAGAE